MGESAVREEGPDGAAMALFAKGWRRRIPYIFRRGHRRVVWGGCAVLLAAFIVLVTLVNATLDAAEQRRRAEAWHVHSFNVLLVISEVDRHLNAALRGERGYLITRDETFLEPYEVARREAPAALAKLRDLVQDNPSQQELVMQLDDRTKEFFRLVEIAVLTARAGQMEDAFAFVRSGVGKDRAVRVFDILWKIESEEKRLLDERVLNEQRAGERSKMFRFAMISFGLALVLLAGGVGLMALDGHVRALDANRALARIARTDALTGLPNLRNFLDEMDKVAVRSARSGSTFSMAMFDIDFFKKINDTHGHPAGDQVLRDVARILQSSIRAGDVAARLGGEEFAVLMPDTAVGDASHVCERIREAVEAHGFVLPSGQTIAVTISAGVAEAGEGVDPSALISRADAALYAAKHGGRNRVESADAMLNATAEA